jgi:hypothetical protein
MTKKNIQCILVGLGRMTALRAQGQRRFDGVVGFGHHGLREDDRAAGPGTARVIGVTGSGTARGAQRRGLREDDVFACLAMTSQAWG